MGELHTFTFIIDNNTHADFASPFTISDNKNNNGNDNNTITNITLASAVPNTNAEPIMMPGPNETKIIVVANNRSINPMIINASGNVTHLSLLTPTANASSNNRD